MANRTLTTKDKQFLKKLGKRIEEIIITERGYRSLDQFALEYHDKITKPSLYAVAKGERDFQWSTLSGLAETLGMTPLELLNNI